MEKWSCVSLFTGAMGLDLGLEEAGFEMVAAVENERNACATIRANRPHLKLIAKDIQKVTYRQLPYGPDLVAGGPPCQAFSAAGARRGIKDHQGAVSWEFVRMVRELHPRAFLMENVPGLLSMRMFSEMPVGSLFKQLVVELSEIGYAVSWFKVNAADYGVPQRRKRIFIIGSALGLEATFPPATESSHRPLRVLQGMVDPDPEGVAFSPRKRHFLRLIPPGGNWRNLTEGLKEESMGEAYRSGGGKTAYWKRLSWDEPSPTILGRVDHAANSFCHPDELRPLTIGECMLIQGFPPDWKIKGSIRARYQQVGNAVPPVLGKMAGLAVASVL